MPKKRCKREPEIRPEYIAKMKRIMKQKGIRFKSVAELRERYEGKAKQ